MTWTIFFIGVLVGGALRSWQLKHLQSDGYKRRNNIK
jgi:hypothetical protein